MRVTPEHLDALRAAITPLDTPELRATYVAGEFPRSELVNDLDKRYRWDLYWLAVRHGHSPPDSTSGYNDAHIDTALRTIVAPLKQKMRFSSQIIIDLDETDHGWEVVARLSSEDMSGAVTEVSDDALLAAVTSCAGAALADVLAIRAHDEQSGVSS